jgi:3-dehydroquinate dehydratase-2
MDILVINGPNLNLLGTREPDKYGTKTLADIESFLKIMALEAGVGVGFFQSNHEGAIVDAIQQTRAKFIIINPAAYTHTSVAIRDAFLAISKPFIEIHLTNIFAREPFRHHSYLSDIAKGIICGLGPAGYMAALQVAFDYLTEPF